MKTDSHPRTEEELRKQLKLDMDYRAPSDEEWRMLHADGTVKHYLGHPGLMEYEEVLRQLRRYVRKDPGRKKGSKIGPLPENIFDDILSPDEIGRIEVLSRTLARLAGRRPILAWMRKELFGGRTLATRTARQLASKVALRHFDAEWFQREGIPIVRHRSYYVAPRPATKRSTGSVGTRLRIEWQGKRRTVNLLKLNASISERDPKISIIDQTVHVRSNSVLGEVLRVAEELARQYDWHEADAVEFILTGTPPNVSAISAKDLWRWPAWRGDHTHPLITLQIEPWLSAETVKRAYHRVQLFLMGKQAHCLEPDSLRLFEFVMAYLEDKLGFSWHEIRVEEERTGEKHRIPWSEIAEVWNREDRVKPRQGYTGREIGLTFRRVYNDLLCRPATPLPASKLRRFGKKKQQ